MSLRQFGWRGLVLGLMLGLGLFAFGGNAFAQQGYVGDRFCGICHPTQYETYMESGHPYKIVHTAGQVPRADAWPHTPAPPLPPGLTWQDVEYVIGNFFWKARFIKRDGFIHTGDANQPNVQWNLQTGTWSAYETGKVKAYDCGKCHTTGYDPAGNQNGLPGLIGTWEEDGVRCEACHGPGGTMAIPPVKECIDCHHRDDQFRIPWKDGFVRHQTQGDDLAHSPHKAFQCTQCHDPHKSVMYRLGGVKVECTGCHQETNAAFPNARKVRVRGGMGEIGLECVDCHMPFMTKSAVVFSQYQSDVRGHIFRIMTEPIAAANNVTGGFWNLDANGDASITLDYACFPCHDNMTLEQAAAGAETIHRAPGMIDLTVNGDDRLQVVTKRDQISVDFSLKVDDKAGMPAEWWVLCQGPRGWSSWDGTRWNKGKKGLRPWRTNVALADVLQQNVFRGTLATGYYTYWVAIYPTDGSENVMSVPVYVTRR